MLLSSDLHTRAVAHTHTKQMTSLVLCKRQETLADLVPSRRLAPTYIQLCPMRLSRSCSGHSALNRVLFTNQSKRQMIPPVSSGTPTLPSGLSLVISAPLFWLW